MKRLTPYLLLLLFALLSTAAFAQIKVAPDRGNEGDGPFERLIIRGATLIDGSGAPPRGPVDIVVEGNRIVSIRNVGVPHVPINEDRRPGGATKEIDAHGSFVLPGFINLHAHVDGGPKAPEAEYIYKLYLAHGITTLRGIPAGNVNWIQSEKRRSAANKIVAPRIVPYQIMGQGEDWKGGEINSIAKVKEWMKYANEKGVEGIKMFNYPPEIFKAAIDEAHKYGMGTVSHMTQLMIARTNARDAAKMGLDVLTHFYGLFESLYKEEDIQHWPAGFNYNDEQHRFSQVARQWDKIHPRGSEEWNELIQVFLQNDLILDPTMTAYLAGRDVMREREAEWHEKYTLPSLWEFYTPNREDHGSYFFDWTTWDEVEWKRFYQVWMSFLNDYKNAGGRVTVSDDAAYIYNLYGFGYVEEMELLQEAGFHPLEVIRGATMHAAQAIHGPKGKPLEYGLVQPGMLADLVIVEEDPTQNLKVLYGTGFPRLNDETGKVERVGGVKYTIKDGIVYDARALLADVAEMVQKQKEERR